MRASNIVVTRKEGVNVRYAVRDPLVGELLQVARRIFENDLAGRQQLLKQLREEAAPPVRASVQLADRYLVLLNNIVPSDTIIIGIKRGLDTGTYLYYADTRGAIIQTVAARCEGQAY